MQYIDVPYYETSIEMRGDVARFIADNADFNSPDMFRAALHPGPISSADIVYKSHYGETLLHAAAQAIGSAVRPTYRSNISRFLRNHREDLRGSDNNP